MANPLVHIELNTTDVNRAKKFYGQLFDWKLEDQEMGASGIYTTIKVGDGTGGGLLKNPMPGAPSFWLAYVLVDDIGAATKKARSKAPKRAQPRVVPDALRARVNTTVRHHWARG